MSKILRRTLKEEVMKNKYIGDHHKKSYLIASKIYALRCQSLALACRVQIHWFLLLIWFILFKPTLKLFNEGESNIQYTKNHSYWYYGEDFFLFWVKMIFSHLSKAKRMFASVKTKFIDYKQGPPDNLFVNERDISLPEDYELMRVKAVGINRA